MLTFGITWPAWWMLAWAVPAGGSVFARPTLAVLYIVGGFGPTIGALIAVAVTPAEGVFAEYRARLLRWRVNPGWYVAALAVPAALAFGTLHLALTLSPQNASAPALEPLARLPILFLTMIVGGGLEELGWRGVAQEGLEHQFRATQAAAIVGIGWALWHLPLFFIHGVSQFGGNFPLFAVGVLANAFWLAWIYRETRSILLCVIFHAASNTATAMGLNVADARSAALWTAALAKLALGIALLWYRADSRPARS